MEWAREQRAAAGRAGYAAADAAVQQRGESSLAAMGYAAANAAVQQRGESSLAAMGGAANNLAAQTLAGRANLARPTGDHRGGELNLLGGVKAVVESGASSEEVTESLRVNAQETGRVGGSARSVPQQIQGILDAFSAAGVKPIRTHQANQRSRPRFTVQGTDYDMKSGDPFRGPLESFATGQRNKAMRAFLKSRKAPKAGPSRPGAAYDAKAAAVGAMAQQIANDPSFTIDQRGVLFWLWMDLLRDSYNTAARYNGQGGFTDTDDLIGHSLTEQDLLKKRKRDDDGDQGGNGGSNAAPVQV